jgi:hypothetical protein
MADRKKERQLSLQTTARGTVAQVRKSREKGWTKTRRKKFLEVLQATANVTEAARALDITTSAVYQFRNRDAGFRKEWADALETGFAELEMALMRQCRFGTEVTETVRKGALDAEIKSTKIRHAYPLEVMMGLYKAHQASVERHREKCDADAVQGTALSAGLLQRIAQVRKRLGITAGVSNDSLDGAAERGS